MVKLILKLFLPLLFLVSSSLACNFPGISPAITDAWIASDYSGEQPTSAFSPEDVFYCIASLESPREESNVRAVWTLVSSEGIAADQIIDQAEVTTRSGTLHFELYNAGPWPEGEYKVDLFLNGVLDQTLQFNVQ